LTAPRCDSTEASALTIERFAGVSNQRPHRRPSDLSPRLINQVLKQAGFTRDKGAPARP